MSKTLPDVTLRKTAIIAGIGYLVIFITGIYANFFVVESLIVPGDPSATALNISGRELSFRFGILAFIIMVIFDVILAWALYILFKPVNKSLSLLSAWLRLVNAVIFAIALNKLFSILHLLNTAEYVNVYEPGSLHAMVMMDLNSFNNIWLIGLVFFGVHLSVLGYLILRSEFVPKIIGILLIIASAGYLADSFANFLLPSYPAYKDIFSAIVILPGVIGELAFTFWLLIKGRKLSG